jgi:putative peptidoglycan lipid II flippase
VPEQAKAAARHPPASGGEADGGAFAKHSVAVAFWTAVSRATGFVRLAVVAAVLGPTYLGNVFQATNNIPNLTYIGLTGALFSNLLVPSLVRHVDAGDRRATQNLAGVFLSTVLAAFAVVSAVVMLAGPVVMRLLAVGVADPDAAASQRRIGFVLLLMFMPQLLMYAVVGTAEAVMNAHGSFALPAAAPILENVGIIATMATTAWIYGTGDALAGLPGGALYVIGIGTTGAVVLHAAVQWWGARRVGVLLLPRGGWRDPEIRLIVRRAVPSLGYSALDVLRPFGAMVVANRVPGGVVAFEFAYSFYILPSALGARPVAVSLLPRLSRLFHSADLVRFRDEAVRGAALVALLVVPPAVAFVVLAQPIAESVTFGQMANPRGQALVAGSLLALGPGVVGFAALLFATYVCYARRDARTPFRAMVVRTAVAGVGMALAFVVPAGASTLFVLGLTVSTADLVGGFRLAERLRRALPSGTESLRHPLLRTLGAAMAMAVPAALLGHYLPDLLSTAWDAQLAVLAAISVGGTTYLLVLWCWHSPELALLRSSLPTMRIRRRPELRAGPT